MSCFAESTYTFYLDGELAAGERRAVEAHLVACRSCRELVVGLQEEAGLLADLLRERPRPSFGSVPRTAPPPRALAASLLPTVGAGALALAVLAWIAEAGLPPGLGWLNPFRSERIYAMAFDLLFALRDRAPELLRLAVALAALGTVALLLLLALSLLARRLTGRRLAVLLALAGGLGAAAPPAPAKALELRLGEEDVTVATGETVARSLLATGDTVRVDGTVEGDLLVAAERLILRGEVRGDVFVLSGTSEISGRVRGSLHAVSEKVRLDGEVAGDLYSVGRLTTLGPGSRVGRDATHVGHGVSAEGRVGRDLFMLGDWLELRGRVDRHVDARVERVALLDGARVGGDVDALFWEPAEVERAPGASVAGEVRTELYEHARRSQLREWRQVGFYAVLVLRLGAAFAMGMLLYALVPALFSVHLASAGAFFRSLGLGFLALLATPVALLLVALTLVGIPVALLGAALYAAALYVSGILVAALVGSQVTRARREGWGSFALALLAGLVLVIVATELPWLGHPVRAVVVLVGLGLLVERGRAAWRATRSAAPA